MKKAWDIKYKGHNIHIENHWINGERLFVDGELQDEKTSLFGSTLHGEIKNGEGKGDKVKVEIRSTWVAINCKIYVNDVLLYPNKIEN